MDDEHEQGGPDDLAASWGDQERNDDLLRQHGHEPLEAERQRRMHVALEDEIVALTVPVDDGQPAPEPAPDTDYQARPEPSG